MVIWFFPYFFPNDVEFSHLTGMASVSFFFRRCDRCPSLDGCRSSLWLLFPSCGGMRMSSPSTATGWSERIWCLGGVCLVKIPVDWCRVAPKWLLKLLNQEDDEPDLPMHPMPALELGEGVQPGDLGWNPTAPMSSKRRFSWGKKGICHNWNFWIWHSDLKRDS